MPRYRTGWIAAATIPLVAAGTFASIVAFSGRADDDPCKANPAYTDVFSVCASWVDNRAIVLGVSLTVATVAGLVAWALTALGKRQAVRDSRWEEPNPGNWADATES